MSATPRTLPQAPSRNGDRKGASPAVVEFESSTGLDRAGRGESNGAGGDALLPLLRALDDRLRGAVSVQLARLGTAAASDPYRGLVLNPDEVERSLEAPAGAPAFPPESPDDLSRLAEAGAPLRRVGRILALSELDCAVLAIAAASSIDERYGRIFAFLQDDVTRKHPSVGLILDLICRDRGEIGAARARFAADAPLIRTGALRLSWDRAGAGCELRQLDLNLSAAVEGCLLGGAPDPRLDAILLPDPRVDRLSALSAPARRSLVRTVRHGERARLYFEGPIDRGQHATAVEIARRTGRPLVALEMASLTLLDAGLRGLLLREALLQARVAGGLVFLADSGAGMGEKERAVRGGILAELSSHEGPLILSGTKSWEVTDALPALTVVRFDEPAFRRRRASWRRALSRAGVGPQRKLEVTLAERFALAPGEVADAVRNALQVDRPEALTLGDRLFEAARAASGRALGEHAQLLSPAFGWRDLVLPGDARTQLRELCQRVRHRRRVLDEWALGERLSLGTGVAALFSGPSGTGKTMAARVIAADLGLDLYRIDLSRIVSKYIGETEKNLGRIFDLAESSNSILFFDEADALFGKRSEVSDSHDRYANIEVGYLLQRIEEYRGITILATNLRNNMDEAFVRRLAFHIHFPMPGPEQRRGIWDRVLSARVPVHPDVDRAFLAEGFAVSGGNICNAAVAGAFLAAEEGSAVGMRHLVLGMRREFQKMGRACVASDFGPWFTVLAEADAAAESGA